jgi:tRNA(Arg) A34 adenosine deaminase TadA
MCAGAIYWSGIGRIVFALDTITYNIISQVEPAALFEIPCQAIMEKGGRKVEVIGPFLQKEAADFYRSLLKQ